MKIESFSVGGKNYPNEDRLIVCDIEPFGLAAILADGMGGLSLGDMAANLVTKSIANYLNENHKGHSLKRILHKSLEYADQEVRRVSFENRSKMGAAVAVAIIIDYQLYFTWQGNVRIYVKHQGNMALLTSDHIANIGYQKTALTRCIKGAGLREDIPFFCFELEEDDSVFICTDGLYKVAEDKLGKVSLDDIKSFIGISEDDASIIQIMI